MARISSDEEVIGDFDEGGVRAVVSSEGRLKGFIEFMPEHVQMGGSIEERKVGIQAVVIEVIWVQSRPGLLKKGVTEAVLMLEGTVPDSREELIMFIMMGQMVSKRVLSKAVGMGFREHVEALALVTSLAIR